MFHLVPRYEVSQPHCGQGDKTVVEGVKPVALYCTITPQHVTVLYYHSTEYCKHNPYSTVLNCTAAPTSTLLYYATNCNVLYQVSTPYSIALYCTDTSPVLYCIMLPPCSTVLYCTTPPVLGCIMLPPHIILYLTLLYCHPDEYCTVLRCRPIL